ncbi:MAG: carbohydrate ABC transporter permease [Clostridia bacterium]|nr:carbohydrate ABC transporter permease [Clostridia bacterium]
MKRKNPNSLNPVIELIIYVILILFTIITLFPITYSIMGSFKDTQELMVSTSLIPKKFTFDNYIYAWNKINYARYTLNSVIVSISCVILSLLNSSMTAYVLSRREFKGKKIIKTMYLLSMFISVGPAAIYPTYGILVGTGLNKSLLGLVVIGAGGGVSNIFLTMGYLNGVSKDYDDAARIDGCSFFKIYVQIMLPLMLPIIGVVGLLVFRGIWNSYLLPMIVTMGQPELQTLPVATVNLKSAGDTATMWSVMLAAANISLIPMIIVYILCNKQFVNGITAGGIKG